jgi:hypothetical protein
MNTHFTTYQKLQGGYFVLLNIKSFLILTFFTFSSLLLNAQTNWTGTTDTDWNTASNWDTGFVPTSSDDVIIPNVTNQPIISSTTNAEALSVDVQPNDFLDIMSGGELSIDGTTTSTLWAFRNKGTVNNDGTVNLGLNTAINLDGLLNSPNGTFNNNGNIFTGEVGVGGGSVINSQGNFVNNGLIEIGADANGFGITIFSLFTNNGIINNNSDSGASGFIIQDTGAGSQLLNNGVINNNGGGIWLTFGGILTNAPCGEYYGDPFNIDGSTVDNYGLMSLTGKTTNNGSWNNYGTIHSELNSLIFIGLQVINDDLIILPVTLTENCGNLSPAFGLGSNLGSTVTIWMDSGASSTSAGTYNSATNTFTPNFSLSNTTYNLYVKVEDNLNTCNDYILPWALTVVTAECDNDGDGYTVSQGDCNDNDASVFPGANVTIGNVTLTTQAEVDAFVNDYSCVNSVTVQDLTIQGFFGGINDISGLSIIIEVLGDLEITQNPQLTNLDGLENITSVGGGARVLTNSSLQNIDGLSGLISTGDRLIIDTNPSLQNINGLSSLNSVGGNFQIVDNPLIQNIDAVSGLTTVGGDLAIIENDLLQNINGLANLTGFSGGLTIDDNAALQNIDPLADPGMTSLIYIQIEENDILQNVDVLSTVTSIERTIVFANNNLLENIDGLSNVTASNLTGNLIIINNPLLCDCSVTVVCDNLNISGNLNINNNKPNGQCNSVAEVQTVCTNGEDADGDGFSVCDGDCDDNNSAVYPNAPEICDGVDNDCNGLTDDADPNITGQNTYYADSDGDGFGDPGVTQLSCDPPNGFVTDNTDCDDTNGAANPNATEICDGIDNNCDGIIDEGCGGGYCPSFGQSTQYEWIKKVKLNTINNTSGDNGGYADFTNISTDLDAGDNYSIQLKPGYAQGAYWEYWCVWIDFNQDGDFEDADELVFYKYKPGTVNGTISIPNSAVGGPTRMRVSMTFNGWAGPCDIFADGEVEDYTVNIIPASGGGNYCTSSGASTQYEWIKKVKIGSINNNSGNDNGYADFTNMSVGLYHGENKTITLKPGFAGYSYLECWKVWVDWNQDGDFDDAGEKEVQTSGYGTRYKTISVPYGAAIGNTRMRVSMKYGAYPTSCEHFANGEVEDYTINVLGAAPAIGNLTDDQIVLQGTTINLNDVQLVWTNNTGFKNDYFVIEKSIDGRTFEPIKQKSNESNSDTHQAYSDSDNSPQLGMNFYRIKVVLEDGTALYSNVKNVELKHNPHEISISPNPAVSEVFVSLKEFAGLPGTIQITNNLGQVVETKTYTELPISPVEISLDAYRDGHYFMSVEVEGYRMVTKRFIVAKM